MSGEILLVFSIYPKFGGSPAERASYVLCEPHRGLDSAAGGLEMLVTESSAVRACVQIAPALFSLSRPEGPWRMLGFTAFQANGTMTFCRYR